MQFRFNITIWWTIWLTLGGNVVRQIPRRPVFKSYYWQWTLPTVTVTWTNSQCTVINTVSLCMRITENGTDNTVTTKRQLSPYQIVLYPVILGFFGRLIILAIVHYCKVDCQCRNMENQASFPLPFIVLQKIVDVDSRAVWLPNHCLMVK